MACLALCHGSAVAQDISHSFYSTVMDDMVSYAVPPYAQIMSVNYTWSGSTATMTVRFKGVVPATRGKMIVEAYFDTSDQGIYDRAVVYTTGGYTFNSIPPLNSDSAGLINTNTWQKVGNVTRSMSGDTLSLSFSKNFVGSATPSIVSVRFLPQSISFSTVLGGMTVLPCVPDESTGGFGAFAFQLAPFDILLPDTCPPSGTKPIPKIEDADGDGPQPPVLVYRGDPMLWDGWVGGFGS